RAWPLLLLRTTSSGFSGSRKTSKFIRLMLNSSIPAQPARGASASSQPASRPTSRRPTTGHLLPRPGTNRKGGVYRPPRGHARAVSLWSAVVLCSPGLFSPLPRQKKPKGRSKAPPHSRSAHDEGTTMTRRARPEVYHGGVALAFTLSLALLLFFLA